MKTRAERREPRVEIFSEAERRAWRWGDDLKPSEWANRDRVLPPDSPMPGRYNSSITPYVIEPMDAFVDDEVEQIWLMWAAQISKSTLIENLVGFTIAQRPAPTMVVVPTEDDIPEVAQKRFRTMVEDCPGLASHVLGGIRSLQGNRFEFDNMTLYFSTAGSAAALARKAIKYIFPDEADKFPLFSGREANPISLMEKRQTGYWDSKLVGASTPTTKNGYTNAGFERSNKCRLYMPCKHCGERQVFKFGRLRLPKNLRNPDEIIESGDCWYECEFCAAKLREDVKPIMVAAGKWLPEGKTIDADGNIGGMALRSKRISGYQLSALVSPFPKASWPRLLAEWFEANTAAGRALGKIMDFQNSRLGEPYEETAKHVEKKQAKSLVGDFSRETVPAECVLMVAGADYHKSLTRGIVRIDYEVMAFGADMRNYTVASGSVPSFDELDKQLWQTPYPWADGTKAEDKPFLVPTVLFIDSRFKPDDVYDYCRARPRLTIPTEGLDGPCIQPLRVNDLEKATERRLNARQRQRYRGMQIILVDTYFFKNQVIGWLEPKVEEDENGDAKIVEPAASRFYTECPDYYFTELTNEHLIEVRNKKGNVRFVWQEVSSGARTHSLDTHVLCAAAGFYKGVQYRRRATARGGKRRRRVGKIRR